MKKLLPFLLCLFGLAAVAQTFPVQNLQVNGTSSFGGAMSGAGLTSHDANVNHVQTVLNVAALRSANCIIGLVYRTQGYAASGDNGTGDYVCTSDTSTTDNGISVIAAANTQRYYLQYSTAINVRQAGAKCDGSTNDSTAFNNLNALGIEMYVPVGTCLVNTTFTKKFILSGAGSQLSIIKPFNNTTAAITYNPTTPGPFWEYSSVVRNIGFVQNGTAPIGVGFTFGATTQANYVTGMELANNVDFYNDKWFGFQKGVQFPFGNIGSSFYECGWNSNYYGVYSVDNRSGPIMHAGNKYFFGGQFGSNTVGIYVFNLTAGFGAVTTQGTIFQNNNVSQFIYTNNTQLGSVNFVDQWGETNGAYQGGGANVNIDVWIGTTATPTAYAPHATIIDGPSTTNAIIGFKGGQVGDVNLNAPNTVVTMDGADVEGASGFGQYPAIVGGANSHIEMTNVITSGGVQLSPRTFVMRNFNPATFNVTSGANVSRVALIPHRYNKLAGSYGGSGTVVNLTAASNLGNGSFNVTAGTASDGVIYGTANTYSAPFTAGGQFTALIAATQSVSAGSYCAMTVDAKVTGGTPTFASHDRSGNSLFDNIPIPETNVWYTLGAVGYFPNSVTTFYGLDVSSPTGVTATFLLSAYQFRCFGTLLEAKQFFESGVYVGP